MKHEVWKGPQYPDEPDSPVVYHHYLTQVHNGRMALMHSIMTEDIQGNRSLQACLLRDARQHLREFIEREG